MCPPTILDVYVSIIRDVALNYVVNSNIYVSDLHFESFCNNQPIFFYHFNL